MLTIKLRDGEVVIADESVDLYQDGFWRQPSGDDSIKPMSKKVFNKFIEFANHYKSLDTTTKKYFDEIETLYGSKLRGVQNTVKQWCDRFCSDLTPDELFDFIAYAKLSGNKVVETLSVIPISTDMNNLSLDDFRKKYNLKDDLTQEDREQLDIEEKIWNTINSEAELS